jgi:hypothetical protein
MGPHLSIPHCLALKEGKALQIEVFWRASFAKRVYTSWRSQESLYYRMSLTSWPLHLFYLLFSYLEGTMAFYPFPSHLTLIQCLRSDYQYRLLQLMISWLRYTCSINKLDLLSMSLWWSTPRDRLFLLTLFLNKLGPRCWPHLGT